MTSNAFKRSTGVHGVVPGDRLTLDGMPVTITDTSTKTVFNGAQNARVVEYRVDDGADTGPALNWATAQLDERTFRYSWGSQVFHGHVSTFTDLRGVRVIEHVTNEGRHDQ